MKQWAKGANPQTADQTGQRASLSAFAQEWQNITGAQRDDWDVYAALAAQEKTNSLGETYSVSGFAWYVALSNNLVRAGLSDIDSAPLLGTPETPTITAANLRDSTHPSGSQLALPVPGDPADRYIAAYASVYNSQGRKAALVPSRWLVTDPWTVSVNINVQSGINTKFGTIQAGQVAFYRARVMNLEGRMGADSTIRVVAV